MRVILRRGMIKLSKIKVVRENVPGVKIFYDAYVLNERKAQIKLYYVYTNFIRSIFVWKWAPRKFWGGGILNLLGLAFIRYYFHNLKYCRRFKGKEFPYPVLKKNGVETHQNFFSQELLQKVLDFYQKNQKSANQHFEDFSELTICNTKKIVSKEADYQEIAHAILNDGEVIKFGEKVTGKKISIYPFVSIINSKSRPESLEQQDGQNIPHVDVFYPSYKIFIYLNNVNTENGAFRYFVGSQEFSFRNAINYYKDAYRYYFGEGKKQIYPTDATLSLYKNDYTWFDACGKPGDAVAFNVQGIHRRGEFKKDMLRERIVLLIDFRQVEVPFANLAANV
jgi:hypothetical protein